MKKNQFLKTLREKISILEDSEIEDIIMEYEGHIEEKISDGKTEKEIVEDFGDIDELTSEILSAYKVKGSYKKDSSKVETTFNTIIDEIVNFFQKIGESFQGKTGEDLIRLICKLVLILILICFLQLPFSLIGSLIENILEYTFANSLISNILSGIWHFIFQMVYFILSVYIVYYTVKKMIFDEELVSKTETVKKEESKKETKTKESKVIYKEDLKKDSKVVYKEETKNKINPVTEVIMLIVKIFVSIMLIPAFCALIGLTIALGIMIACLFEGIYLVSLFFIVIGLIIMTSSVIGFVSHIVFKKEAK